MLIVQPVMAVMSVKSRWVRLARSAAIAAGLGLVSYVAGQVALAQSGQTSALPAGMGPSELALVSSALGFVGGWLRAGQNNDEPPPSKGA